MPTESAGGSAERGTATTWRRLAGLLAVATGGYALVGATGEMAMLLGERLMALFGVAAVGHGLALVAGADDRLGRANGPLVCLWAGALIWVQSRYRSAGFADGGLWSSNPGNATWMVGLAALALGVGVVASLANLRRGGRNRRDGPSS